MEVLTVLAIELRQGRSVHRKSPQIPGKRCWGRKIRKKSPFSGQICGKLEKNRAMLALTKHKPSTSRAKSS